MGAFNSKPPITIPKSPEEAKSWGWDEWETITLKGRATTADLDLVEAGRERGKGTQSMLVALIIDWTLLNEQGLKVDVKPEAIALLPPEYAIRVIEAGAPVLAGNMTEEQAKAFLASVTEASQRN
jgi:hypothetical protein